MSDGICTSCNLEPAEEGSSMCTDCIAEEGLDEKTPEGADAADTDEDAG